MRVARHTRATLRAVAMTLAVVLLLTSCGSQQGDETGAVSSETVKQLEGVLQARAAAMAKGDREAFLKTIDTTRSAFRRIQLTEFEFPSLRGGLDSTFKLSTVERFRGYIRGFIEETLEGNAFPGAFVEPSYSRRYFRSESGRWILTEPLSDELGAEKQRAADGVELTYWALDEDVADVFLKELEDARRQGLAKSPKPLPLRLRVAFIPTAGLAGPGWDGFASSGGGGSSSINYYPLWYAFDRTRDHLSAWTRNMLFFFALDEVRNGMVPGVVARLSLNDWLIRGWIEHESGIDVSVTLRQSCVGVPVPTLKQLADGTPPTGGIAPESFGRHAAYSASMIAYMNEKYGVDAYWRLISSFMASASASTNFPKVLGVTPDEFYASWLTWLKKKYC